MEELPRKRVVGFSSMAWQETASQRMEGVLKYLEDVEQFTLCEYRFMKDHEIDDKRHAGAVSSGIFICGYPTIVAGFLK